MNMSKPPRHLALRLPHLLAAVEERLHPALAGRAFALCSALDARGQLLGVSPAAAGRGLQAGQRLGEARRRCPELLALPADPARARAAAERVGRLLGEVAPAIRQAQPGDFLLDLSGCRRLHPDELALGRRLLARLAEAEGLPAAAGIASSALAAQLLARRAAPGEVHALAGTDERRVLAAFPLAGLPGLPRELLAGLAEAGVRLVGEARRLPPEALLRRWGAPGRLLLQRLDELKGGSSAPPGAPPPAPPARELGLRRRLAVDSADPALLHGELFDLAEQGLRLLHGRGLQAGRLLLRVDWCDGRTVMRGDRLQRRAGERELTLLRSTARRLLDAVLEARRLRVSALELRFGALFGEDGQQELFDAPARAREQRLAATVESLRQRYGHEALRIGLSA
jgi:DNA polymerase IV